MIRVAFTAGIACIALAGCASTRPVVPMGAEAYRTFPSSTQIPAVSEYRIGAFDVISISTFQEEGLTLEEVKVDSGGGIIFPLIGPVQAAGRTAEELANDIAAKLGQRYLVDPQVTVAVNSSAQRKVTVEGAVNAAGVFPIEGRTTLLQALALARGPNEIASLDDVVIFRTIDGQRMAAAFNLVDIRRGIAEDPAIFGNDIVVVGASNGRQIYRDILSASPLIAGIFRPIAGSGNNN